jgi:Fe2+ or Zn2+ uptake regulation protein
MSESVQQSIELLKTQGLRITAPRKAILEVLATAEGPFSSEETFGQLKDGSCDLVTCIVALISLKNRES